MVCPDHHSHPAKGSTLDAMHSRFRLATLALLGLSALLLAACQPAEPRATQLDPQALLQLRFDKPDAPQDLDVSDLEENKNPNPAERTVMRATVVPLQLVRLDETHALLLTDVRSGEDCHACPGVMGAYAYERDARGWRLAHSQDAVLSYGGYGRLGALKVHTLAPGRQVATLDWGSCWQGLCGSWLQVLDLQATGVRVLGASLPFAQDNDGMYEACSRLDGKARQEPPAPGEPAEPLEHQECRQVEGDWRFEGGRLRIDFSGRERLVEGGVLLPVRRIAQRAVYELQPATLQLVEGENPVTGF